MRTAAKKVTVAATIVAALVLLALAMPSIRTAREVADVSIASPPAAIATTAPILIEVPTLVPTVAPTAAPTAVAAVVVPSAAVVQPTAAAVLPTPPPTVAPTATVPPTVTPVPLEPAATATAIAIAEDQAQLQPTPTTEPTATPTTEPTVTATALPTVEPTATATVAATATATVVVDPTATPTATVDSSQAKTAANDSDPEDDGSRGTVTAGWMYVDSDNGLYLRSDPGGSILSVLTHRSQVHATGRAINLDQRTWMEVDIPAVGWVALEFLSTDEPAAPPVIVATGTGEPPTAEDWALLRNCESSGNYAIVDASGLYHGAYQFLPSTWDGLASRFRPDLVGVLPSQAAPADQDAMAQQLYALEGARPWPSCGRFLL